MLIRVVFLGQMALLFLEVCPTRRTFTATRKTFSLFPRLVHRPPCPGLAGSSWRWSSCSCRAREEKRKEEERRPHSPQDRGPSRSRAWGPFRGPREVRWSH